MKFFDRKLDEEIIKLLQQSEQKFDFDENRVKNKLLYDINETKQAKASHNIFTVEFFRYATVVAVVLIFSSGTFALASNAQPGDKLFPLNKLGEQVMLSLPFSLEQKANLQALIVTKRLQGLQQIKTTNDFSTDWQQNKRLETVRESDESLKNAIETVSANKSMLEARGQIQTAQKLNRVLSQLNSLAQQHEEHVQELEDSAQEDDKQAIETHLKQIKNTRHKARLELKLENPDNDSED